MVMVWFRVSYL